MLPSAAVTTKFPLPISTSPPTSTAASVVSPVTPSVLESVAAPVTPRVVPTPRLPEVAVLPSAAVTTNSLVAPTVKSEVTSSVDPTVAAPLVSKVVDATCPFTVITPDARPIRSVSPLTPMLAPANCTDSTAT